MRSGFRLSTPWYVLLSRAVVLSFGMFHLIVALKAVPFSDGEAYWLAGLRIRDGLALYPGVPNPDAADVYRYAPWFAWLWAPLTQLPKEVVASCWIALLLGSGAWVAWRVASLGWTGLGLLAIMAPLLLQASLLGNVQPLMVAALLGGVESRAGPLLVGVAASLKGTPLLLASVYAGRRQWWRAAIAVGVTAALVLPMFFTDLSHYPGTAGMEPVALPLLGAIGIGLTALAVIGANTQYSWLLAAVAVMISQPRPNPYNLTFLIIGLASVVGTRMKIR